MAAVADCRGSCVHPAQEQEAQNGGISKRKQQRSIIDRKFG